MADVFDNFFDDIPQGLNEAKRKLRAYLVARQKKRVEDYKSNVKRKDEFFEGFFESPDAPLNPKGETSGAFNLGKMIGVGTPVTAGVASVGRGTAQAPSRLKSFTKYLKPIKDKAELKSIEYVSKNMPKAIKDYQARIIERFGSDNIISADEAKYVMPDFKATTSGIVHNAASALSKLIFDDKLIKNKGKGNNTVMFLSGGTGSGKTTALKTNEFNPNKYSIIYDTNLTGRSAGSKVEAALKNGYKIEATYVQRDPVMAFVEGVLPRVKTEGRLLSIDEHIARHMEALPKLEELKKIYGDKLKINYIDNTGPRGTQKVVSFDKLPKFNYTEDELRRILNEKLDEAVKAKRVTPDEAAAIRGSGKSPIQPQQGSTGISGQSQGQSPEGAIDPVQKIISALKEAKPIRESQEALYSQERGRRIAKSVGVGQKTAGEKGFYAEKSALKGELPKVEYESLRPKLEQVDIDSLFDKVKTSTALDDFQKITARDGLVKLLGEAGGGIPTEKELEFLNKVFGSEFTKTVMDKRTGWKKMVDLSKDALNIPRAIMSSTDFSYLLRQFAFELPKQAMTHPGRLVKNFGGSVKMFASPKAWQASQEEIASRPTYELMKKYDLALTDMMTYETRDENFASSLAERIPALGHLIKASGRSYTGFLNKMRADMFDDFAKKADLLGIEDKEKFFSSTTEFINAATGRGNLNPTVARVAPVLNGLLFSPRLIASRIYLLRPDSYMKMHPEVRKEALKSLFAFTATGMSVLGLAKMGGAEVGMDPTSADFGKIKVGDTRWDIWGGFQQYIKLVAQLMTGKITSSTTGTEMRLGEGYKPLTRLDITQRFFEYKTAPAASFAFDLMRGETAMGEDLTFDTMIARRFIPMVVQDMAEAYEEWGPQGLILAAPSIFGVSSQTYGFELSDKMKAKTEGMSKERLKVLKAKELKKLQRQQQKKLRREQREKERARRRGEEENMFENFFQL